MVNMQHVFPWRFSLRCTTKFAHTFLCSYSKFSNIYNASIDFFLADKMSGSKQNKTIDLPFPTEIAQRGIMNKVSNCWNLPCTSVILHSIVRHSKNINKPGSYSSQWSFHKCESKYQCPSRNLKKLESFAVWK